MRSSIPESSGKRRRVVSGHDDIRREADGSLTVKVSEVGGKSMRICCTNKEDALLVSGLAGNGLHPIGQGRTSGASTSMTNVRGLSPNVTMRREEDSGAIVECHAVAAARGPSTSAVRCSLGSDQSTLENQLPRELLSVTKEDCNIASLVLLDSVSMEGFQTPEEQDAASRALCVVKRLLWKGISRFPKDPEKALQGQGLIDRLGVLCGMQCVHQTYGDTGAFKMALHTSVNEEEASIGIFETEEELGAVSRMMYRCKRELQKHIADHRVDLNVPLSAAPTAAPTAFQSKNPKAARVMTEESSSVVSDPVLLPTAPSCSTVLCPTNIINLDDVRDDIGTVQPAGPSLNSQGEIPIQAKGRESNYPQRIGGSSTMPQSNMSSQLQPGPQPQIPLGHRYSAASEIQRFRISNQEASLCDVIRSFGTNLIPAPFPLRVPQSTAGQGSVPSHQPVFQRNDSPHLVTKNIGAPPIQLNRQGQESRQVAGSRQNPVGVQVGLRPNFVSLPLNSCGSPGGQPCLPFALRNPMTGPSFPFTARDPCQQIGYGSILSILPPSSSVPPQTASTITGQLFYACCKMGTQFSLLEIDLRLCRAVRCKLCGEHMHTQCAMHTGRMILLRFQNNGREREQLLFTCICGRVEEILSPILDSIREMIRKLISKQYDNVKIPRNSYVSSLRSAYISVLNEILSRLMEMLKPARSMLKNAWQSLAAMQTSLTGLNDVDCLIPLLWIDWIDSIEHLILLGKVSQP